MLHVSVAMLAIKSSFACSSHHGEAIPTPGRRGRLERAHTHAEGLILPGRMTWSHDCDGCAEIEADEKHTSTVTWAKNGNLGRFTNFVNLMDMAAVAVPSGILRCKPAPSGSTGD